MTNTEPTPVAGDVEKVAKEIWRAEWAEGYEPSETWEGIAAEDHERAEAYRHVARAAIAALPSEREQIVAWLAAEAKKYEHSAYANTLNELAERFERGEHLLPTTEQEEG